MPKQHSINVVTGAETHSVALPGVSRKDYNQISKALLRGMASGEKVREAIADAFELAIDLCPDANHSDIWCHIIYRQYLTKSTPQSWVRTSGEGFEVFLCRYYTALLAPHGIHLSTLFDKKLRKAVLAEIGLPPSMGGSKLDIAVFGTKPHEEKKVIGGIHAKGSLAERVSDDAPVSKAMLDRGYWSPLCTLDVKTYPPRDLTNRGELGTPLKPSDKRGYIEQEGLFSACYSYNQRTFPSADHTTSGRKVYRLTFQKAWDQLCEDAVAEMEKRFHSSSALRANRSSQ